MAFNDRSFDTRKDEKQCKASTAINIFPGIAVKKVELAKGSTGDDIYHKVTIAGKGDPLFGTVSHKTVKITDKDPGSVVLRNAAVIVVMMNANAMDGDLVYVATMDGKWEKTPAGERAQAELIQDALAGELAYAVPVDRVV
jgi:hypothetical protein